MPWPGLKPGLLDPESSALTIRPRCLPVGQGVLAQLRMVSAKNGQVTSPHTPPIFPTPVLHQLTECPQQAIHRHTCRYRNTSVTLPTPLNKHQLDIDVGFSTVC